MKMLRNTAACLLLSLLACSTLPASAATGCRVSVVNGVVREFCDFSTFFPKYDDLFDFRKRVEIRLPNLVPDGIHYLITGGTLTSAVDVENVNAVGAFAHNVAVVMSLTQTGRATQAVPFSVRVPGVPGGSSVPVVLPAIDLLALGFTRSDDIDVVAMIVVDPGTAMLPAWAEILEADETDNSSARMCRIYGEKRFDTSVRRCR